MITLFIPIPTINLHRDDNNIHGINAAALIIISNNKHHDRDENGDRQYMRYVII